MREPSAWREYSNFFPAPKSLGSLGDGGAVVTDSNKTADKVYQLHDHGRDVNGDQDQLGPQQSARQPSNSIPRPSAPFIRGRHRASRHIYCCPYQEQLGDLEQLQLPASTRRRPTF